MSLLLRALAVWLLLVPAAILNGFIRESLLAPRFGEPAGHVMSTLMLSVLIFAIGWLMSPWLALATEREAWLVGGGWLLLTLAFELLAGHFLFGASWRTLFADYNVSRGRIWILVLIVTALTPPLVYRLTR